MFKAILYRRRYSWYDAVMMSIGSIQLHKGALDAFVAVGVFWVVTHVAINAYYGSKG